MPKPKSRSKVKVKPNDSAPPTSNIYQSPRHSDWKLDNNVQIRVTVPNLKTEFKQLGYIVYDSNSKCNDVETQTEIPKTIAVPKSEPDSEFESHSTKELFQKVQQLLGNCSAAEGEVNCRICSEVAIKLIQHIRVSHSQISQVNQQINQELQRFEIRSEPKPQHIALPLSLPAQQEQIQNVVQIQNEQEILMCEICGALFDDQENLNSHMDFHSNEILIFTEQDVAENEDSNIFTNETDGQTEILHETQTHDSIPISPEEVEVATSTDDNISQSHDQNDNSEKNQNSLIVIRHNSSSSSSYRRYSSSLITCVICGRGGLISQAVLQHHIRLAHPPGSVLSCRLCPSVFSARHRLEKHFRDVHGSTGEKIYKCDLCPKSFFVYDFLKSHVRKSHNQGQEEPIRKQKKKPAKPYHINCDICGKPFQNSNHMKVHRKTHTRTMLNCEICYQRFLTPETLASHRIWNHTSWSTDDSSVTVKRKPRSRAKPGEKRRTKCTICHEQFWNINFHFTEAHPGERRFKCQLCPKAYHQKPSLKLHMDSVHGEKMKCKHCDKGFPSYTELNAHFKIHVDQGIPAMTPWVVKNANYYSKAKARAKLQLNPQAEKIFPCNICTKTFGVYRCLVSHVMDKHGEISGQDFRCKVCEKEFFSTIQLNRHMKEAHPGIRPYQCKICKQRFEHPSHLNFHSRKHKAKARD